MLRIVYVNVVTEFRMSHMYCSIVQKKGSVRERFGVRDGSFRDIGDLMNSMDVNELIPFVYNCVKLFD